MKKYLIVLLLLAIALPVIVIAGSSNVTAITAPTATPTPTTVPSFFMCTFGVHVFPGADPMGSYTVNIPDGSVSGYFDANDLVGSDVITVYLSYSNNLWYARQGLLGMKEPLNVPVSSYITTVDENGNYAINNVVYGHYYVFWSFDTEDAQGGYGIYAGSANLTASSPHAVVDIIPRKFFT